MDDPAVVDRGDRVGDLEGDRQEFRGREGPAVTELAQRLAAEVLEDQREAVGAGQRREDPRDPIVIDVLEDRLLALEGRQRWSRRPIAARALDQHRRVVGEPSPSMDDQVASRLDDAVDVVSRD
ncbi:MAG: hypothetical protein R3B09_21430 [Nannocystaceae bacterium]